MAEKRKKQAPTTTKRPGTKGELGKGTAKATDTDKARQPSWLYFRIGLIAIVWLCYLFTSHIAVLALGVCVAAIALYVWFFGRSAKK